ncbi:uncharacterized protein TNCV_330481 [Trichonephila clavipes]|nr:uncharacterized protein TNCV_330481 [Trichonephila clavipes]
MKTRCLKCGENHRTGMCEIKDKIEDPLCINCKAKGHMASSVKCPLFPKPRKTKARRLRMVQEDTGAPNEGATCAWMAVDEAVGCTRAFLTMWRSSRRLVCRGSPETGLRVNDISRIHWSQHLLTTQSERPN